MTSELCNLEVKNDFKSNLEVKNDFKLHNLKRTK